MKYFYLILLSTLSLIACKEGSNECDGDIAFIGGEIINPIDNFVVILKANHIIDTIKLDNNNRFIYKVTQLKPSLYTFKHGREVQMVLLEPNDSVLFRLNTKEFDESLVFTGKGAKKNNYLINRFLESENEKKEILRISQASPQEFEFKLDSLKAFKITKLKTLNNKYSFSPLFNEIAEANINYNYYTSKEVYPFVYYRKNERKTLESLPKGFYSYRNTINYNNINVVDYFPYYQFLEAHFENLALSEHFKKSSDNAYNQASLSYTIRKLNLIDSLVTNEHLKNYLLSNSVFKFINATKKEGDYDIVLQSFKSKSTSDYHKEHFTKLINSLKHLKSGSKIPEITISDFNDTKSSLKSIIYKPTVIFFWNYTNKGHFKNSHFKAKELRKKYPEIDFIAININSDNKKLWKKNLRQYGYETSNEYQFINPKKAKLKLAINPINKVILVNKYGKIINSNTNMFSIYFEEQLLGMINK